MGTGKMAYDPHTQNSESQNDTSSTLGLYAGFKLNTPFLKQWGGMILSLNLSHKVLI